MTISDWLMILAVLSGPIIAVQLTRYLDNRKEARERRLQVFKTLMATRGSSLSFPHVEALNRIDLEFSGNDPKNKKVIEAWKAYLDLLADTSIPPDHWGVRRLDLFVDLLHEMAKTLDYSFDKTHIKNSAYAPKLYGEIESFQNEMRTAMRELMASKRAIPVLVVNQLVPPRPPEEPSGETE